MKQQRESLKSFSFNMTRTFSYLMTEDASQRNSEVVEQEQDSRNLTDELWFYQFQYCPSPSSDWLSNYFAIFMNFVFVIWKSNITKAWLALSVIVTLLFIDNFINALKVYLALYLLFQKSTSFFFHFLIHSLLYQFFIIFFISNQHPVNKYNNNS